MTRELDRTSDASRELTSGKPRGAWRRAAGERILIVGTGRLVADIVQEFSARSRPSTIVGIVSDGTIESTLRGWPQASLDRLDDVLDRTRPTRIIVDPDRWNGSLPITPFLDAQAAGVIVEDAVAAYERLTGKAYLEALTLAPRHVVFSAPFQSSRLQELWARALSVVAAIAGLVALAPLFVVLAILIKLDSSGPVLFVQERLGRRGKPFSLLKFRTMHPVTDERSQWRGDNANRVTRVGRLLSRCRLDELPQLVNLLRGDMDLVGPRPHPVSNVEQFQFKEKIECYALRLLVRPGITGWAQVRYKYADNLEEEREKMRYDLYYIKHRSVKLDVRIVLSTLRAVMHGSGVESAEASPERPVRRAA